jgi:hypothetical protein
MSLSSFVAIPEVRDKVKPLLSKLPRKIAVPLQVEPRSNCFAMVGTAFDYLLRFELQRRAPHAVAERWVAESVPDMLWKEFNGGAGGFDFLVDAPDPGHYLPPQEGGRRARAIVENAKAALADHLKNKKPTRAQLADLAAHAIRLARLDEVYRAMQLNPLFEQAGLEDVEDLLAMLDIVPFESLLHTEILLLNPNFKESSLVVDGADTDLIAGDLLVDFKVTKNSAMSIRDLDQLLGYYFLARNQRRLDAKFPEIGRVAIYFCRHGHLWVVDVSTWTKHPDFTEIEKWFFTKASAVFGSARASSGEPSPA